MTKHIKPTPSSKEGKPDKKTELDNVLANQLSSMASQGAVVEVDPEFADTMGAFEENALSVEDASDARFDDVA